MAPVGFTPEALDTVCYMYPHAASRRQPQYEVEHEDRHLNMLLEPPATPLVAVVGVGYVGACLVEVFSREYDTLGYDLSETRINNLKHAFSPNSRVVLTANPQHLEKATHYLISVPTPLLPDKSIDLSCLRDAVQTVAAHARRGSTIVIESSVALGTTRRLLGPLAKHGRHYAGMSPERIDPGRAEPPAHAIPKVVSGLDDVVPGSLDKITQLYGRVFRRLVPVSTPEVAEMTKLYENCQRMICLAYANEMADACMPYNINPFEVCAAASTKPFGYLPFTPGVGVGGPCLPVNPYYLLSTCPFPLLRAASETMSRRPANMAKRAIRQLMVGRFNKTKPRVLVVGVAYKAGQPTITNSPGLDLIRHLSTGTRVVFADPLVSQHRVHQVQRLEDSAWNRESLLDKIKDVAIEWWCK
ncbi:UDP-glucose/GDP-mannose dehydrogenase family, NAD binding domain-containing protein [Hirsutella rhossiliensis]|uniref:UDP-glucose/GDP-mannose dehydrogenase family, NAD binding domain-containing protein n=1 Tax=Hirsutella rhossiliensis TaxID=111463 RepID=A0A9P8MY06_9HYPO|nr:UDP-glucose/GDP-mannose dehydrogenase family, NAD binding domain-containing protein [Hirsutella rhossiliensis]KAH0962366.1 UDP-glucose/GDP-mannose dehydrogenase family, NAD binding domain-containing protein [Hirsutella rhossiliensis]